MLTADMYYIKIAVQQIQRVSLSNHMSPLETLTNIYLKSNQISGGFLQMKLVIYLLNNILTIHQR